MTRDTTSSSWKTYTLKGRGMKRQPTHEVENLGVSHNKISFCQSSSVYTNNACWNLTVPSICFNPSISILIYPNRIFPEEDQVIRNHQPSRSLDMLFFSLIESNDMRMWQAQMHLDLTLKVSITKKVSLASDAKYCEMVTWGVLSQWIQYILNRQYTTRKQTNGGANGQRHAACNDIHTSNHIMLSLSMKPNKTRWCCVCVQRCAGVQSK